MSVSEDLQFPPAFTAESEPGFTGKAPFEAWGRYPNYNANVVSLHWQGDYPRVIDGVHHGILPVGMGRSYGDVCLLKDGTLVKTTSMNRLLAFDAETGVLTAMAGEIWIDPVEERVVRLAGSLQQDKEIGLGIIGELDKGGWIEIDQADVGEHQWRIVHLKLVMNGRVLFKAKNSNSVQEYSEFQSLPPELTYKQAIQMLRGNSWNVAPAGH